MTPYIKSTLCLTALMTMSSVVSAQFSANSDAPVSGSADAVDYAPNVTIFTGQVDVRQGDVRILSDRMLVHTTDGSTGAGAIGAAHKIEAIGNFYFLAPQQEVRGNQGVYIKAKDSFTVTGDVVLLQVEDNVVPGDELVYNLSDGTATVVGTCKGRKCGSEGRVNILLKNTNN